jgi:hypothetical protein
MITFGEEGGTATSPCFESGAGTLALWLSGPPLASGTKKYGWITRDECCMPDARCCLQGRKDGVYSGRKAESKEEKCGAGRTVPSELFSALWLANFECQPRANVSRHGPAKAKVNRQVNT